MLKNVILAISVILMSVFLLSCGKKKLEPIEGSYSGRLILTNKFIPFDFEVLKDSIGTGHTVVFKNDTEKIVVPSTVKGDSIHINFPLFESEIIAEFKKGELNGKWINHARKDHKVLPFIARKGNGRDFGVGVTSVSSRQDCSGKWKVEFIYQLKDTTIAEGRFVQKEGKLTGTFLTTTGDYRFLEGIQVGNKMYLSCFDGSHAFLFEGEIVENEKIIGEFWSGDHWYESFIAYKDESFSLPDQESLTTITDPQSPLSAIWEDIDGKSINLDGEGYIGKPLVVQIMSTSCPNCKDQCVFLKEISTVLEKNEINWITMGFERSEDRVRNINNLKRLRDYFGMTNPVVLGGEFRKDVAKMLPRLEGTIAYPTTIFMNADHRVVSIHTGFSGPATEPDYSNLKKRYLELIDEISNK